MTFVLTMSVVTVLAIIDRIIGGPDSHIDGPILGAGIALCVRHFIASLRGEE